MKTNRNKKLSILPIILILILSSCNYAKENPFWGDGQEKFEVQAVFEGERFPNVVVAMDGSVIATWGRNTYQVKRSEDGGATWGETITLADPGFMAVEFRLMRIVEQFLLLLRKVILPHYLQFIRELIMVNPGSNMML